jgi:hypothetical protein
MYSYWRDNEATPVTAGAELEYYDHAMREGRLELRNEPGRAGALADKLRNELIPGELQRPLPEAYRAAQQAALVAYWKYVKLDDWRRQSRRWSADLAHGQRRWHDDGRRSSRWRSRTAPNPGVLETRVTHAGSREKRARRLQQGCTGSGRASRSQSFGSRAANGHAR